MTRRKNKTDIIEKVNGGGGQTKSSVAVKKCNTNLNTITQTVGEASEKGVFANQGRSDRFPN